MSSTKKCEVCGQTARSIVDSAIAICSACTMFVKRNWENRPQLECKSNGDCDLRTSSPVGKSQQRRLCPACRMAQCLQLGLRMKGGSLVVQPMGGESSELPSSSASTSSAAQAVSPPVDSPSSELPEADGWRVDGELGLLAKLLQMSAPRPLYFDEYAWIESRVLVFACETISEILSQFENITEDDQKKVLLDVAFHASLASKLYFVMKHFPEQGDSRLALFPGYFIDLTNSRPYFRALNDEQYKTTYKFLEPFHRQIFTCAERARRMRPTPVECAALFSLSVYDKLERLKIAAGEAVGFQERLCMELGRHLKQQLGSEVAVYARLCRLITYLNDSFIIATSYDDIFSILGLMLPEVKAEFPQPQITERLARDLAAEIAKLQRKAS
ncbi:Nuclear hormone receptor FTZ-F1 beta-like [Aphelenchoides fujianensis]|nr:Nuclear hormone receptor FTZ-F1 beta-like [Aphelenchoides fujianensis]